MRHPLALAACLAAALAFAFVPALQAQSSDPEFATGGGFGYVCGYTPAAPGGRPKISLRNPAGTYELQARLEPGDKLSALGSLAPGTPVTYSMALYRNFGETGEAMPTVAITDYEAQGEPSADACAPGSAWPGRPAG
ncbi:MAG: hypothetical protein LBW85_03000 [Deltaproteobacteria bacterium]|jgi:hypothetical protein|nr:hypothetical protein [Deltaproteobacteria bacterium]